MSQLKCDEHFKQIIDEISYWEKEEDIPIPIIHFLKNSLERKIIFNTEDGECYCYECMNKLEEGNFCTHCHISYQEEWNNDSLFDIACVKEENRFTICYPRYVFDIKENSIFLYKIIVNVRCYYNIYIDSVYRECSYEIGKIYSIEKDFIFDIKINQKICFEQFYQYYKDRNFELELDLEEGKVYTENLEKLKNTIYQYTYLWNVKEYLQDKFVSIKQLVFLPLYFPQFEYLMKSNLFSLAFFSPAIFDKNKNFQELFQIDKKYLPFMKENNITYEELKILKVYPTKDISLLRYLVDSGFCDRRFLQLVEKYKISLVNLKDYLSSETFDLEHKLEYRDYLFMAAELGLDLKDKKVLYPKDFLEKHDELFLAIKMIHNPDMDEKIKNLSAMLSINSYEDNAFIIFPAHSIEDLVREGSEQHNCVRMYCDRVASGESHIYFMRKKQAKEKSFVTIEVVDNKIVQAKVKYNVEPSQEVLLILKRWEKNLIPIES